MNQLDASTEYKVILVTGGCGSIGSTIVFKLLEQNPKEIRVLDSHELSHFNLKLHIQQDLGETVLEKVTFLIGDISDGEKMNHYMEGVDWVIHTAALKHVSLCEENPIKASATNITGTINIVNAAVSQRVKKVIFISTDKAVEPNNVMGATKFIAERIMINTQIANITRFACIRFGNVFNSQGSVVPLFLKQIQNGGPVTVTSPEMTRFFMSLEDAAGLILKAVTRMEGGEVFILPMNKVKIDTLARRMINIAAPFFGWKSEELSIKIIGAKEGEGIHEKLATAEELPYLKELDNILVIKKYGARTQVNENESCFLSQCLNSKTAEEMGNEELDELIMNALRLYNPSLSYPQKSNILTKAY